MAVLAVLSYRHVKQQLYRQSEARLEQANRALGQAVFERLLLLDATLKSIPPRAVLQLAAAKRLPKVAPPVRRPRLGNQTQTGSPDGRVAMGGIIIDRTARASARQRADLIEASKTLIAGLDLLARQRFVAVEFVGDDGKSIQVFGRLSRRPRLSSRDSSDLRLGLPLVSVVHFGGGPRVYLLRRLARKGEVRGTFVGEVSPDYLWGSVEQSVPSPNTRVAVLDELGRVLFSAPKRTAGTPQTQANETWVDTSAARTKENYLTASSAIPLDAAFAGQPWTVLFSESKDEVLEPM